MPKLIVHIGLPKTATTALQQDIFENACVLRTRYLGVLQPRDERRQLPLYRSLYSAICRGEGIDDAKRQIAMALADDDRDLVLSDEMIVVSQGEHTWRAKLANLARTVDGIEHHLVVTVREPAAALFSYYTELYPKLSREQVSFRRFALADERGEIFHYRKLSSELRAHFDKNRISVFKFEDIIRNDIPGLADLLGMEEKERACITLSDRNARRKDSSHVFVTKTRNLLSPIRGLLSVFGMKRVSFRERLPMLRPLADALKRLPIPARQYSIPKPDKSDLEQLRRELADETSALLDYCEAGYSTPGEHR
jgi:hypothetical protein